MFFRNRIAAPRAQSQTINPSPQESGGLGALNQTQQPAPPMPIQPTFTPSAGMPFGGIGNRPFASQQTPEGYQAMQDYYAQDAIAQANRGNQNTPMGAIQPTFTPSEGMPKYAGGPNPAAPFYTDGPRNPNGGSPTNPFLGMPMPRPTLGMPLGGTNPDVPTNPFPGLPGTPMPPSGVPFMPLPGGDSQYPRGDFEPKNPFGGSPTNPFPGLPGTPMPRSEVPFTGDPGFSIPINFPSGPFEPKNPFGGSPTNPFPGTPMPPSGIPFMPGGDGQYPRGPFDPEAVRKKELLNPAPPNPKPQNRPNPFLGGLGSLLNRKFGSRR